MTITDVPNSGTYVQQAAIFSIIATITDLSTGLPIPLQAATGLAISVLFPDETTMVTFAAELYTDGSDGKIVYTTAGNGTTGDLSQVGLYHFQGQAVISGTPLPPSYQNDFYVLPNVFGGTPMNTVTPSGVVLFDSSNVRWVGMVNPNTETLLWVALASGPSAVLQFNQLIMKDDIGVYWTVVIDVFGNVTATPSGVYATSIDFFTLMDVNGKTWIVKISESGVLTPS